MRLETRGPKIGACNICGLVLPLTDDHVPPKGVPRVGQAFLMELVDYIGAEKGKRSGRHFQNGVKYRSLCSKCNNERLGARCDGDLVDFTNALANAFGSRLFLPIELVVRQNRISRCVVGHLLAHGLAAHRRTELDGELTDYFLDDQAAFPESLRLYYWVYPYNEQIVVRAASGYLDYQIEQEPLYFMLMKFFPVAFLITRGDLPPIPYQLSRLDNLLTQEIDDSATLTINIAHVPNRRWPEAPGERGIVMHTKGSTGAVPRRP